MQVQFVSKGIRSEGQVSLLAKGPIIYDTLAVEQQAPSRLRQLLAEAGLVYAAIIWGATFFIVKGVLQHVDPLVLVGYRFLLAGVLLLALLLILRKPIFPHLKQGLLLGFVLWMLYAPQTIGLEYTSASNSGFITGLFVVFVPILAYLFWRKSPSPWEYLAVALSVAGLWLLTGGIHGMNFGDAITLLAALMYALHLLLCDRVMKAGLDPLVNSCQQFIFVGLLSLAAAAVLGRPFEVTSESAWWTIIFLALFPTLSAFLAQLYAQKIASPFRTSLIFTLEPVFAAIFAWTLGGEQFVMRSALGGLLIFVAMIVAELPVAKQSKPVV